MNLFMTQDIIIIRLLIKKKITKGEFIIIYRATWLY